MRWIALLLALFVGSAGAQVSSSRPLLGDKWTTAPAACAVGQIGFDTDATAGANIYGCTAANTWTAQGGTGTVSTVSFTGGLISIANPTTTPAFTVAGTSGGIPYFSGATTWASSAALTQYGLMVGGGAGATPYTVAGLTFGGAAAGTGLYLAAGTATTDVAALSITRTNNNAAVATGVKFAFTDTTSAAGFLPFQVLGGAAAATNLLSVDKAGLVTSVKSRVTAAGSAAAPALLVYGTDLGLYTISGGDLAVSVGGATVANFSSGLSLGTGKLKFYSAVDQINADVTAYRSAAGALEISDNANGKAIGIKSLTELTTIAAAATTDTTIQIPANAIVLGVSVRVTTVIPTATTFTVIGTTSSTAFNTAAVSTAATATDKGTAAGAYVNTTAQTIRITPNLTPGDATGRVRVTIHFIEITPPTS